VLLATLVNALSRRHFPVVPANKRPRKRHQIVNDSEKGLHKILIVKFSSFCQIHMHVVL